MRKLKSPWLTIIDFSLLPLSEDFWDNWLSEETILLNSCSSWRNSGGLIGKQIFQTDQNLSKAAWVFIRLGEALYRQTWLLIAFGWTGKKGVNDQARNVLWSVHGADYAKSFCQNQWKTRKKPRLSGLTFRTNHRVIDLIKDGIPTFLFWIDDNYLKANHSWASLEFFTSDAFKSALSDL